MASHNNLFVYVGWRYCEGIPINPGAWQIPWCERDVERNSDTAVKFVTLRKLAQQFSQLSEYRERGFEMAFTLGYFRRIEYHLVRSDVSDFERRLHLRIFTRSIRVNSRAITIRGSFADSNFCERAKLEATRVIERKGERLCWEFNVKSLYTKVPRRRSTYVKFQSTQTWDINLSSASLTLAISSRKISLYDYTPSQQVDTLLYMLLMIPFTLFILAHRYCKLMAVVLKIHSRSSNSRLITLEFLHSNDTRQDIDVRIEDS